MNADILPVRSLPRRPGTLPEHEGCGRDFFFRWLKTNTMAAVATPASISQTWPASCRSKRNFPPVKTITEQVMKASNFTRKPRRHMLTIAAME
ncbi:MAG: hypothetical protein JNM65_08720 [Verrucomicrobiaceae bacterium]|nr:hypothetical protein [Verrucomicrobiaceae bacterium]